MPSRIGYGYYDGAALKDGWHEIRPRNGATWLEAYFDGYGWVPIVGVPLQAKNSNDDKSTRGRRWESVGARCCLA